MVLDEPQADDEKVQVDRVTFIIDRRLSQSSGGVLVDYVDQGPLAGYRITPGKYPYQGHDGASCSV